MVMRFYVEPNVWGPVRVVTSAFGNIGRVGRRNGNAMRIFWAHRNAALGTGLRLRRGSAVLMVRGDAADQERPVARAIAAGVNYFDTAVLYGDGESKTTSAAFCRS